MACTVQFFDERHHGGIRHKGGRHRLQDGQILRHRQAGAPLRLTGHGVQGEGPLSTSSQSGWLNSCSAIAVAPSGPRTPLTMATRIPAHHHPAQIEITAIVSSLYVLLPRMWSRRLP